MSGKPQLESLGFPQAASKQKPRGLGVYVKGLPKRPQSSSFWGFMFRIPKGNPKKELLWGLEEVSRVQGCGFWDQDLTLRVEDFGGFEGLGSRVALVPLEPQPLCEI